MENNTLTNNSKFELGLHDDNTIKFQNSDIDATSINLAMEENMNIAFKSIAWAFNVK